MKKILLTAMLLAGSYANAQQTDIKAAIDRFFSGMHTSDTLMIRSVCGAGIILQTVKDSGGQTQAENEDMKDFLQSIASLPQTMKIEERLLSYDIKTDGPLAHAWTPYEFYINGKLSHSGVNSFTLIYTEGKWQIIYIIDTRRKPTR